ncbi:MAG TPA: lamin tail domain-containing protein, partial [Verrucomicrobiae bacterium]
MLCLLGCGLARGQLSLDREPPGPSSRKTGLVITEIMYHPRPVPGLTNRLQFIEIFNSKPWDEAIGGFSLDGTIRYTFASNTVLAAGAYLVVARDPGFLQTNYSITNVVGPWVGSATNGLSIDRGTVLLRNRQGAVLLTVNYSDAPPWPVAADGSGHSIVLARPSYGEDDARAWAESDVIGGSPGLADPVPVEPLASVVINEWMAHTDLPLRDSIELYNHANVAVDLSGAYLSDTPDTNRYRIPNGTIIGPGGFRAFDDSILNFSLFAEGETIFLVNSNQTRVIDAIDFKGMSNSVSAGRYPDGGPLQYALASRTFGGPN